MEREEELVAAATVSFEKDGQEQEQKKSILIEREKQKWKQTMIGKII
jgi:hypothetical protein